MTGEPLISCLCLSYRRPSFLKKAIECFEAQTYSNRELIVISHPDDEKSGGVVREFNNPTIKFVTLPQLSFDELTNLSIEQSAGDYFCIWDDDDFHHARRLELQFRQMEMNGKEACILAYCLLYDNTRGNAYLSFPYLWYRTLLCKKSMYDIGLRYRGNGHDGDLNFVIQLGQLNSLYPLLMPSLYTYIYHGANSRTKGYFDSLFSRSQKLPPDAISIVRNALYGSHCKKEASALLSGKDLTSGFNFIASINTDYSYQEHYTKLLQRLDNRTVLNGPFKGLKYPPFDDYEALTASAVIPKLVGCYENELKDIIQQVINDSYTEILNIGCAEGYYANGLALKCERPQIYAYDTDSRLREICADMSRLNNVADRVHVSSNCTSDILKDFPFTGKGLIICDCEGYEYLLFQENNISNLRNCDLLIEAHDFINLDISPKLEALFRDTHQFSYIKSVDDVEKVRTYSFPPFEDLTDNEEKRYIYAEHRPCVMEWIWLKANHSNSAEMVTITI
ncbi:MAG: glycosyltransferase family A protein [Chitinophagaceae bacterium]